MASRTENEGKFGEWKDDPDGTRTYWYTVHGKQGWYAKYIKCVDANERTIFFRQEVYNQNDELVEVHEKYPHDKGHKKLGE